jgi:hypothetical protein
VSSRSNLDRMSHDGWWGFNRTKAGGGPKIEHGCAIAAPHMLAGIGTGRHSDA